MGRGVLLKDLLALFEQEETLHGPLVDALQRGIREWICAVRILDSQARLKTIGCRSVIYLPTPGQAKRAAGSARKGLKGSRRICTYLSRENAVFLYSRIMLSKA